MDSSSSIDIDAAALAQLSAKDKAELQQFLSNETSKARIQQGIHSMADTCFKKCIAASAMDTGRLTTGEQECTRNCVGRFLDCNEAIIKKLGKGS